jgi:hypothetical protein
MRFADHLGVGTVLAGYRVESLLGRGGMSTVCLAGPSGSASRSLASRAALTQLPNVPPIRASLLWNSVQNQVQGVRGSGSTPASGVRRDGATGW